MSLEVTLERIAFALEKLAVVYGNPMIALQSKAPVPPPAGVSADGATGAETVGPGDGQNAGAAGSAAQPDREAIKKALREKGIKFKDAARTETLQALLEKDVADSAAVGAADDLGLKDAVTAGIATEAGTKVDDLGLTDAMAGTKLPAETGKPVYTRDQVAAHLMKLSTLKGREEAIGLLKGIAKAEKLSDVQPIMYGALIDACKVRGVVIDG